MIVYAAETPLYMFFLTGSRTMLWISVEFLRMGRYFTTYMNLNETSYTYLNFWQHSITKGECYRAQCVESSEDLSCSVSLKTVTDFLSVDPIPCTVEITVHSCAYGNFRHCQTLSQGENELKLLPS